MEISYLLNQSEFFKGLSPENKVALEGICVPKTVGKGENLFLEWDKGYALYLLATGNIQLYKSTPDSREMVIKVIKPGEIFAEVILFEMPHYPVNARALKKSLLYVMPKMQFQNLLPDMQ